MLEQYAISPSRQVPLGFTGEDCIPQSSVSFTTAPRHKPGCRPYTSSVSGTTLDSRRRTRDSPQSGRILRQYLENPTPSAMMGTMHRDVLNLHSTSNSRRSVYTVDREQPAHVQRFRKSSTTSRSSAIGVTNNDDHDRVRIRPSSLSYKDSSFNQQFSSASGPRDMMVLHRIGSACAQSVQSASIGRGTSAMQRRSLGRAGSIFSSPSQTTTGSAQVG